MTEYAAINTPENYQPEPTADEQLAAILAKPWKEKNWKERLLTGTVNTGLAVAGAVIGVAAASAVSGPRRSLNSGGWNPQSGSNMMQLRSYAPTAGPQWEPWMSQGQLNCYDGRTYYPIGYGTRF